MIVSLQILNIYIIGPYNTINYNTKSHLTMSAL